jgi:hypothetical protein
MHKNCKCPHYIRDINKKQVIFVNLAEVETLRKLFLSLFALAFIFTLSITTAFADEGHSHDSNFKKAAAKFKNGSNTNQEDEGGDHGGHSNQTDENHDSTSSSSHTEEGHGTADDHSGQDDGGHEREGHHGPVVETPPNYKVLGTYGAVNLSFILIGVWNKWFRRKENK